MEGVAIVTMNTLDGRVKKLHRVQCVPGLAHNLLSVGQLLTKGYSMLFEKDNCIIRDDQTGAQVISIPQTKNNMFPMDISSIRDVNIVVNNQSLSDLWHMCFGNLN